MQGSLIKTLMSITPFLSLYFLLNSTLYMLIYWHSFDVEPLTYIGITEVLSYAESFLFAVGITLLSVLFIEALFSSRPSSSLPTPKKSIQEGMKHLFFIFLLIVGCLLARDLHEGIKFIPYSLMFLPFRTFRSSDFLEDELPQPLLRSVVIAIILVLPLHAFVGASNKAYEFKESNGPITMIKFNSTECSSGCAFIGKLGEYLGVYTSDKQVVMFKTDFVLQHSLYSSLERESSK